MELHINVALDIKDMELYDIVILLLFEVLNTDKYST